MPFYEYQCGACGAQVEVLQKITDAPLKKCPECGQGKLTKLVSAPVFRLKGGGWYETDFKTDKDNKRNLVDADRGEAGAEGKAEGKAEDKPGDKAGSKPDSKSDSRADSGPDGKAQGSSGSKPAAQPAATPARRVKPVARKVAKRKAAR